MLFTFEKTAHHRQLEMGVGINQAGQNNTRPEIRNRRLWKARRDRIHLAYRDDLVTLDCNRAIINRRRGNRQDPASGIDVGHLGD